MKISRRRFLLAGSAAVVSAACAPTAPASSSTPAGAATATSVASAVPAAPSSAAAVAAPLRIGVLVPYTEQAVDNDIGLAQRRAAELYLKQRGGKLGGRSIDLVLSDESTDPATDEVKVRDVLLGQDKVALLMGGSASTTAYVLRNAADSGHLAYLDTWGTGNALTRAVAGCKPSCKSPYVLRTSASSWQLGEPLGDWLGRSGPAPVFAVHADDDFGSETTTAFAEGLAKHGGSLAGRKAVPRGSDQAAVVAQIKAQPAKSVFAAFITDDAEAFLTQWGKAGMRAAGYKLYGPGTLTETEVLLATKDAGTGAVTSHYWSTELDNAENKKLIDAFRTEYKDDETGEAVTPDGYAIAMWDAMAALDQALGKTKGDAAADALIAAFESAAPASPRGSFSFDTSTHNVVQDIYIREVRASPSGPVNVVVDRIQKVIDPGG